MQQRRHRRFDLDGNPLLKIVWGVRIIGTVSWVMVAFVGIDGVKMLSNPAACRE